MTAIRKNDERRPTPRGFLRATVLVVLVLMTIGQGPVRADTTGPMTGLSLATIASVEAMAGAGTMASDADAPVEDVPHATHAVDGAPCADRPGATAHGGADEGSASRHVTHAEHGEGCPMSVCVGVCAGSGVGMMAAVVTGLHDAGARAIIGIVADGPRFRSSASGVPLRPPKVRAFIAG